MAFAAQTEIENVSFLDQHETLPPIRGNSGSLQPVIANGVKNARDAMPKGRYVVLLPPEETINGVLR